MLKFYYEASYWTPIFLVIDETVFEPASPTI